MSVRRDRVHGSMVEQLSNGRIPDRQTDRQTDRQILKYTNIHTNKYTDRQTNEWVFFTCQHLGSYVRPLGIVFFLLGVCEGAVLIFGSNTKGK